MMFKEKYLYTKHQHIIFMCSCDCKSATLTEYSALWQFKEQGYETYNSVTSIVLSSLLELYWKLYR